MLQHFDKSQNEEPSSKRARSNHDEVSLELDMPTFISQQFVEDTVSPSSQMSSPIPSSVAKLTPTTNHVLTEAERLTTDKDWTNLPLNVTKVVDAAGKTIAYKAHCRFCPRYYGTLLDNHFS